MTNQEMLRIAMKQSAEDMGCQPEDFLKENQVPASFIHVPVSLPEGAADTVRRFIELALQTEA